MTKENKIETVVDNEIEAFLAQLAETDLCAASLAELHEIRSKAAELHHDKMTAIPADYTPENYC